MFIVMRAVMRFELYKQKSGNKSFRFNVKTLTNTVSLLDYKNILPLETDI